MDGLGQDQGPGLHGHDIMGLQHGAESKSTAYPSLQQVVVLQAGTFREWIRSLALSYHHPKISDTAPYLSMDPFCPPGCMPFLYGSWLASMETPIPWGSEIMGSEPKAKL